MHECAKSIIQTMILFTHLSQRPLLALHSRYDLLKMSSFLLASQMWRINCCISTLYAYMRLFFRGLALQCSCFQSFHQNSICLFSRTLILSTSSLTVLSARTCQYSLWKRIKFLAIQTCLALTLEQEVVSKCPQISFF